MLRKGLIARVTVAVLGLGLGAPAVSPSPARALALLPLARGQLTVLLGQTDQWQPQAGAPLTLTLIGGPPRGSDPGRATAVVALQPVARACGASPRADHAPLLAIPGFYGPGHLVSAGSPLAPDGGAQHGVYAASLAAGVLSERGAVRACTWLVGPTGSAGSPRTQAIPLLNGLFGAAVWSLPGGDGYGLDATAIGTGFSYTVDSAVCGEASAGPRTSVGEGDELAAAFSLGSLHCAADGSRFAFFSAHGDPLGAIAYSDADARATPAVFGHLGGCELGGVDGLSLAASRLYVAAVGCRIARVLTAPYDGALARGHVGEAQIDGGEATLAPAGTAVDLVTDGS